MFLRSELRNDSRVEREAHTLVQEGWEVRVIAANDPFSPHEAEEAYERRDGFEIVRVDRFPLPARLAQRALQARAARSANGAARPAPSPAPATASRTASARAVEAATAVARLPWRVGYRWMDSRRYVRRAVAAARRWPADLWICHDLDALPAGVAARRALGGALVYDSHELWQDRTRPLQEIPPERWRWRRMERTLIRTADRTMTVCDSIADILAERYAIVRPAVVRNVPEVPPDVGSRDLRALAGIAGDGPLVLCLGGMRRHRGIETLIEAMAGVPGGELVLMGSAAPEIARELEALADRVGVRDRVHIVRPVPVAEVVGYARSAAVGVAPIENAGLNHWYSLPNKLFEYLHAGLPVVTSDFPEMARVVAEHEVGETFRSGDPADLARALAEVLEPTRHARLAQHARAAARELTWDRERERFLAVVDEALGRRA